MKENNVGGSQSRTFRSAPQNGPQSSSTEHGKPVAKQPLEKIWHVPLICGQSDATTHGCTVEPHSDWKQKSFAGGHSDAGPEQSEKSDEQVKISSQKLSWQGKLPRGHAKSETFPEVHNRAGSVASSPVAQAHPPTWHSAFEEQYTGGSKNPALVAVGSLHAPLLAGPERNANE